MLLEIEKMSMPAKYELLPFYFIFAYFKYSKKNLDTWLGNGIKVYPRCQIAKTL